MKRIWNVVALLGCMLWCTMAGAQQTFVVRGEIENLSKETVFHLCERRGNAGIMVDNDTLRNASFCMKGTADSVKQYDIMVYIANKHSTMYTVWVQAGDTVTFRGKGENVYTWDIRSTNPLQAEQAVYDKARLPEQLVIDSLRKSEDKWRIQRRTVSEEQAKHLNDSIQVVRQQVDELSKVIYLRKFSALKARYLKGNTVSPFTPCGLFQLKSIAGVINIIPECPWADDVKSFFRLIPEDERQTLELQMVEALLFPPRAVKQGEAMYDEAVLYDLQGNTHRLSDYNKGKYLLLDFWSGVCGPCLASIPELNEVSALLKDSLVVIGISEDTEEQWKIAVERYGVGGVQLNDFRLNTSIFAHYGVNGTPYYVIISPEGKIEKVFTGYSKGRIKQKLSSIFPQLKSKKKE